MKKYIYILIAISIFGFSSCQKDNYDEPKSTLKGQLVSSDGSHIGVKGTDGAVQLQLWQDGYDLYEPIAVYVNQNGEFAATLFDGDYKLVTRDNNGPWVNDRDTVFIKVKKNTTVDYKITPYFQLKNENFSVKDNILTATFDVDKVANVADREIDKIVLLVNNTVFVDNSFKKKEKNADEPILGSNTIKMDLNDLSGPNFSNVLYARIGIAIKGVDQWLYTTGSVKVRE